MSKEYQEPEDLLTDESFLSWYLGPGREADSFWVEWASGSQERKVVLERAVALLEMTRLRERAVMGDKVERATAALLERIGGVGNGAGAARERGGVAGTAVVFRGAFGKRVWVAAACVLVVVTGAIM